MPQGVGLRLITGKALHFLNTGYANHERHRRRAGDLFTEVHAADARERHLTDGSTVRAYMSPRDNFSAYAQRRSYMHRAVAMPLMLLGKANAAGHRYDRYARRYHDRCRAYGHPQRPLSPT